MLPDLGILGWSDGGPLRRVGEGGGGLLVRKCRRNWIFGGRALGGSRCKDNLCSPGDRWRGSGERGRGMPRRSNCRRSLGGSPVVVSLR